MQLLQTLVEQYQSDFREQTQITRSIEDIYHLMCRVIIHEPQADNVGLQETLISNMGKAFQPETIGSVEALKMLSTELEVYLRKVIIILEGNLDNAPKKDGKVYLKEACKHLGIDQVKPIKSALTYYDTRNQQAHNSLKLPLDKYYAELKNIILTYLVGTETRFKMLYDKVFPEENFTKFLQGVVDSYNEFKAAFVDLEVKEYIDVLGKQVVNKNDNTTNTIPKPITQIRKDATKNQMMVLGQAGMGKTTSMLYMAMKDAEELLKPTPPKGILLPVYVTLASFTDREENLEDKIAKRLERTIEFTKSLLIQGKITLFLDGFNELLDYLVEPMRKKIQAFIDNYPKTKILIASRPTAYEEIDFKEPDQTKIVEQRLPIAAFLLLEMKDKLLEDFVRKNCKGNANTLIIKLTQQPNLYKMLQTPLYLAELLRVYEPDGELPASTSILTGKFLELKYKREKEKNSDFDRDTFHNTMFQYTLHISITDKQGIMANPQIAQQKAIDILQPFLEKTKMAETAFLKYAVDMNIFLHHKHDNSYSFAHQSYQDYYLDDEN